MNWIRKVLRPLALWVLRADIKELVDHVRWSETELASKKLRPVLQKRLAKLLGKWGQVAYQDEGNIVSGFLFPEEIMEVGIRADKIKVDKITLE